MPTERQIHALEQLYLGRSIFYGLDGRYQTNMGGAVSRLKQRLGEAGWLVLYEGRHSRHYTDELTAEGLRVLRAERPGLEGINERLRATEEKEAAAKRAAEAEADAARRQLRESAARRATERVRIFRELMQSYQVNVDGLTDDQVRTVWAEIVNREMKL